MIHVPVAVEVETFDHLDEVPHRYPIVPGPEGDAERNPVASLGDPRVSDPRPGPARAVIFSHFLVSPRPLYYLPPLGSRQPPRRRQRLPPSALRRALFGAVKPPFWALHWGRKPC